METPGHLAPHWRDPTLDPAGRQWQSDMKDEAQKRASTGKEKTKPHLSWLLHLLPSKVYLQSSLHFVTAKLKWRHSTDRQHALAHTFCFTVNEACTADENCPLWTLTNFIQRRENSKDNFRHLRNKLQEETYLCAFPSWGLSNIEAFRCFSSYWL